MKKYPFNYKLDPEEQQILEEIERGEWKSVPNAKSEIKRYREIARATLARNKNINNKTV